MIPSCNCFWTLSAALMPWHHVIRVRHLCIGRRGPDLYRRRGGLVGSSRARRLKGRKDGKDREPSRARDVLRVEKSEKLILQSSWVFPALSFQEPLQAIFPLLVTNSCPLHAYLFLGFLRRLSSRVRACAVSGVSSSTVMGLPRLWEALSSAQTSTPIARSWGLASPALPSPLGLPVAAGRGCGGVEGAERARAAARGVLFVSTPRAARVMGVAGGFWRLPGTLGSPLRRCAAPCSETREA